MNKFKVAMVIALSVIIVLMSPSYGFVSADEKEKDIFLDNLKDNLEESIKYSIEFGGKDCFLMLIPAPETNDPIAITLPNIDDDIAIKGKEYNNPRNPSATPSIPKEFENCDK